MLKKLNLFKTSGLRRALLLLTACIASATFAQTVHLSAELDTMTIVIGDQVGLTVTAIFPETSGAALRQLPDTLTADIEVVKTLRADTAISNGLRTLEHRYLVTSFDTGLHYVPPIKMLFLPDGTEVETQPLVLNVVNPFEIEVDEESGIARICDIKAAHDAPFLLSELLEYWPWFVAALVLIGAVVGAIMLHRYYEMKRQGISTHKPKKTEPCDAVAMRELLRIKDEKLWQHGRTKEFYSELTDALRIYVGERYGMNAMESTTDEIIENIFQHLEGDINNKNRLQDILVLADYVKFAKFEPLPDENDTSIKKAIEFVKSTAPVAEKVTEKTEEKKEDAR